MAISVKAAGAYTAIVGVQFKKNGVYAAVQGAFVKASGAYTSILGPTVPIFLGQVATGTFINDAKHASNKQSYTRTPHYARVNITSLQILIPNWYVVSQTETNGTGTATWKASIEYPAGIFTQLLFSGSASGVVTPGNNLVSDALTIAIPKGEKFWVRSFQTTTGEIMFFQFYAGDGTAQAAFAVSGLTDMTLGGTAATSASSGAAMIAPCAIIANTTTPAIGIYGDSISVGRGDTSSGIALQGHLGRAYGALYPCGHVGVSGDQISAFLLSNSKRMALAAYFSHIHFNFGINDITVGGKTAAQVQTSTNSTIALFGSKPVGYCTLGPVSTSTDVWTTTINQTTSAFNSIRAQTNSQRLSTFPTAKTLFDVNPIIENVTSPEDGIWNVTGGSNTSDGTHPNANGYSRLAAAINTNLLF